MATTRLCASAPFPGNIKSAWCPIFSFHASCHFRSPSLSSLLGHVGFLKSVAFLQQSIILCNYCPITDPCSFSLETRHAPLTGRCIRSLSCNLAICRSKLQSTFTEGHNLRYLCFSVRTAGLSEPSLQKETEHCFPLNFCSGFPSLCLIQRRTLVGD